MTHPTDDEIMKLAGEWFHTGENQKRDDGYYYRSLGTPSNVRGSDLIEFARALLAEQARTQTHKAEDAPSDAELLDWLIATGRYVNRDIDGYRLCEPDDGESINGPFDDGRETIRRAIAQERKA